MNNKCCRLSYIFSPAKVIEILATYGNDVDVFDNTMEGEPKHGWLLLKPKEGFPCDHLVPSGCKFQIEGNEKPIRCKDFPVSEFNLRLIDTCGYYFVDGVRRGSCTRCE